MPLCHFEGECAVLFTLRSQTVSTHQGQVSFPGGIVDPTDESDLHAGLREVREEIGIDVPMDNVWGELPAGHAVTGVRVTPFVAFLGDVDPKRDNFSRDEIDEVFCITLRDLMDPKHTEMQDLGERGKVPAY